MLQLCNITLHHSPTSPHPLPQSVASSLCGKIWDTYGKNIHQERVIAPEIIDKGDINIINHWFGYPVVNGSEPELWVSIFPRNLGERFSVLFRDCLKHMGETSEKASRMWIYRENRAKGQVWNFEKSPVRWVLFSML